MKERNNKLYNYGIRLIEKGDTKNFLELKHRLEQENNTFDIPLPDKEVEHVALAIDTRLYGIVLSHFS